MTTRARHAATRSGSFCREPHHNAATCGVDFWKGEKQTARGWPPEPFESFSIRPLSRSGGGSNTGRNTCTEGEPCPRVPRWPELNSRPTLLV